MAYNSQLMTESMAAIFILRLLLSFNIMAINLFRTVRNPIFKQYASYLAIYSKITMKSGYVRFYLQY